MILDFDATPIDVHSEKERAAGHYKGGFGFNPLLVTCGREVLAGILRPGNAGANNAGDHLKLLDLALEQLPPSALDGEILARSDSAGASHDLADACRETAIRFSFGYPLTEPVREALQGVEESAWQPAIEQDGEPRDGAWVTELTGTGQPRRLARRHPADLPARAPAPRCAAIIHRPGRPPLPVLHHRPSRRGHRELWRSCTASTPRSRTGSRRSRRRAPATCRSTPSPRTPPGSSSPSPRTT